MQTGPIAPVPDPAPEGEEARPADLPLREGSGEGAGTALARLIEQERERGERRSGPDDPEADEPERPWKSEDAA